MNHSTLSIDIETYSDVDLTKCGVYAYTDSPNFEVLLFGYAFDDEPVQVIDLASGERLSDEVTAALTDPTVTKTAFNASFERVCLGRYLDLTLPTDQWYCTATQALLLGLPLSLKGVGAVLGLEAQKLSEGDDLIRYFSVPCKATKANGGRTRNRPGDAPDKWARFIKYNIRDVEVEREIRRKLKAFPIPPAEQEYYLMDQNINDRGVLVDPVLVEHAVECDLQYKDAATARAYELTGLENPNSVSQVKGWLAEHGVVAETLDKKAVRELIKEADGEALEMLKLRLLLSKTSVKSMRPSSARSARMVVCMAFSNFMEQTARGDGHPGSSKCKTFPKTIYRIWSWHGSWCARGAMRTLSFSSIIPPVSYPSSSARRLFLSPDHGFSSRTSAPSKQGCCPGWQRSAGG